MGISQEDLKGKSTELKKGGLAVDSYGDLKKCVELYNTNRFIGHKEKVSLIKGDLKKTMPEYIKDNPHTIVSLLYLDLDGFEPTKIAIEQLISRMPKGSIIAFDQLHSEFWPGETLSVLKTLGINNLRIQKFPFEPMISFAVIE